MKTSRCRYRTSFAGFIAALILASSAEAATLTVTSTADAGGSCPGATCTLRQAIAMAAEGDTVTFSLPANSTITLTSGELLINKDLRIAGPGANLLTVARDNTAGKPEFRVFNISPPFVSNIIGISGLTISNGRTNGVGGGILHAGGVLTLTNNAISGNLASNGGGIWSNAAAVAIITGCTVSGNIAVTSGAGIELFGAVTVINSTISGNTAQGNDGGGFYKNFAGTLTIINSTIYGNGAVHGGGIATAGSSTPILRNTILAGNTATMSAPNILGTVGSNGHNLIGSTAGGTYQPGTNDQVGLTNGQVNLGPLQDNGGPTKTMTLLPGSLAIDRGQASTDNSGQTISSDQRGQPRRLDRPEANGPGSDTSDIGAVELGPPQTGPAFTVTTTLERLQDGCTTDDCSLVEALNVTNAVADANTINFTPGLSGLIGTSTITPSGLAITNPVTINGPGARVLTISGNNASRLFNIASAAGTVSISGLTLSSGRAGGGTFLGNSGGAVLNAASLTLTDCTVSGNFANLHGGAIYNNGQNGNASLTVVNCTLSQNVAEASGGAIFSAAYTGTTKVDLTNCTLDLNYAKQYGGAIYNDGTSNGNASVTLTNCTLNRDDAGSGAGGIYNDALNPGTTGIATVTLRNTILRAGTVANLVNDSAGGGAITSQGSNLSSDAAGGAPPPGTGPGGFLNATGDKRNTDPKLDTLKNNGGQTDTPALLSDSPAINTGNDGFAPATDQRGFYRSGVSDIGAFEFGGPIPSTLANISTRLRVETGDNVLFGGFIITGTQAKKLIVRAIGPSVPVGGRLENPTLELYSGDTLLASNDNWMDSPERQAIIDSTIPPANDLESAIVRSLAPGAYTTIVRGVNQGTGVGLVEIYDLDGSVDSKLAQISTRGFVQTGDNAMFGGLYVVGGSSQKVIVRAIGPSLSLLGKLADPTLELYDGNGTSLGANDNWRSGGQEAEIIATTVPPSDNLESAIVRTFAPGPYTAIVRGVGDTTGIALVEVYALQ